MVYVTLKDAADVPVRRLTDTGTLYTDVGQSKFFDEVNTTLVIIG